MKLLDGYTIAKKVQDQIKNEIARRAERTPCLAAVLVGDHAASKIYVSRKLKACQDVGMISLRIKLEETVTEEELRATIQSLNEDPTVDGILVQLPLPRQIDPLSLSEWIDPRKDVDGFHPQNVGYLALGQKCGFIPCTPRGVMHLLHAYQISMERKHAVIIGRSAIVGKPMAQLLLQKEKENPSSVTIVTSTSPDIKEHVRMADILICAAGRPNLVTEDMVKKGAVVVDVGINRVEDSRAPKGYKVTGDVDFEKVQRKCSAITPVPGGVGPMTIAMLLLNTWEGHERRR